MDHFDHEKLDVYRVAIDFVVLANDLCARINARASLRDQLQRASTSITLNIAEGAGEFAKAEKRRFYRIARRSATECAAALDVCRCCHLVDDDAEIEHARQLLLRIVAMLTHQADRGPKDRSFGLGLGLRLEGMKWRPSFATR